MFNAKTIEYQLQPFSISQHLFKVNVFIPANQYDSLTFSMPAWIPGSYMVRDFAKNVCQIQAKDESGNNLAICKIDKQTWQTHHQGCAIEISYLVYAFDPSVRSAYLNDEYGFINGTSAFIEVKEFSDQPCKVTLLPFKQKAWRVITGMPSIRVNESGFGSYQALNYAALIDYPILFGEFIDIVFFQDDIEFTMVYTGHPPIDLERIVKDLKPVLQQQVKLFEDQPPIDKYLFITLLTENGYGGLEHKNSTVLMFSRWDLPILNDPSEKTKSYRDFLALCSHEFLHTWHVKRTRPKVLLEPDLSRETYTEQLWIYEGFTSFYDDLALARSGVITPEQYLEIIGMNITRLLRNPGRLKQAAAESSFDAWTRFYQQDANSINHIVSYYTKGGLIALCLDIYIRENSSNQYSLDDVMRSLWQQFGKLELGTDDDVIAPILESLTGKCAKALLQTWVYSPGELPLATMLRHIGVGYHERHAESFADTGGKDAAGKMQFSLGINTKSAETGLVVTQVREASMACDADIQVNDKLIAIDGWQVKESNLHRLLSGINEATAATIHLLRDGRLVEAQIKAKQVAFDTCFLTIADKDKLNNWLGIA